MLVFYALAICLFFPLLETPKYLDLQLSGNLFINDVQHQSCLFVCLFFFFFWLLTLEPMQTIWWNTRNNWDQSSLTSRRRDNRNQCSWVTHIECSYFSKTFLIVSIFHLLIYSKWIQFKIIKNVSCTLSVQRENVVSLEARMLNENSQFNELWIQYVHIMDTNDKITCFFALV